MITTNPKHPLVLPVTALHSLLLLTTLLIGCSANANASSEVKQEFTEKAASDSAAATINKADLEALGK